PFCATSPCLLFHKHQPQVGGEFIHHVEPKGTLPRDKSGNGSPCYAGFPFQNLERQPAADNSPTQFFGYRGSGVSFHAVSIVPSGDVAVNLFLVAVPFPKGTALMVPLWDRGRQRPQESAGNVPSKRGASVPTSTALWQSPNAVAGYPAPESAPVNNLDQATAFEPPDRTAYVAAVPPP